MRTLRNDIYRLPQLIGDILPILSELDHSTYLVGGIIRNSLMNMESSDIDLAVTGDSLHFGKTLSNKMKGRYIELDNLRGISRVIFTKQSKTFQLDISQIDQNIEKDVLRRDFTVNAMALHAKNISSDDTGPYFLSENLYDPCNGIRDVNNKTIKSTHEDIFAEDPIRLLRAIRISSQFNFAIAPATKYLIKKNAHLLLQSSPERIRDEFLKILSHDNAAKYLRLLDKLELLEHIIEELTLSKGVKQPKQHYWDVFNHQIECVEWFEKILDPDRIDCLYISKHIPTFKDINRHFNKTYADSQTRKTLCKLACLLHDIAKPHTKTIDQGKIRFLGHHISGSQISTEILQKLHFSNKSIDLVATQVLYHLRPSQMAPRGSMPSKKSVYKYYRDAGIASIDTLYLNLADYLAARGPKITEDEWRRHCGTIDHILKQGFTDKVPSRSHKLLTGHDIMVGLGLKPGPIIGELIAKIEEAQIDDEVKSKEEALELLRKTIESGEHFEKECQNISRDSRNSCIMRGDP